MEKPSDTLRSWVSSYSNYREDLGRPVRRLTGEHVGEPRLLICLYDSPLLHVDLKFMSIADIEKRVDEPVVLWERDNRLSQSFASSIGVYPTSMILFPFSKKL